MDEAIKKAEREAEETQRELTRMQSAKLLPKSHERSDGPPPVPQISATRPRPLMRQKSSFEEPYRIQRANSHHWLPVADYTGPHEAELRNGFLRKVFGILLAQIALTAYVSIWMLNYGQANVDEARAVMYTVEEVDGLCRDVSCGRHGRYSMDGHCDDGGDGSTTFRCPFGTDCSDCGVRAFGTPIPVQASAVALAPFVPWVYVCLFLSLFLVLSIHCYKNNYPVNYFLLFTFTLVEAFMVGFCCTCYGVDQHWVVYEAFALTGAIFLALTTFTIQSKIKMEVWSGSLFCALFALIFVSYLRIHFFPESTLAHTVILYFGIVIFSIYIIYDVSMICDKLGYDDYIVAALELYLDIINLFLRILALLGGRSSNN